MLWKIDNDSNFLEGGGGEKMEITITIHRLTELEGVIEKNLKAFYEVGAALLEIRESKLYKDTHTTFEDYCRDRWDMTRDYAYKLIGSSQVVSNLGNVDNCLQKPSTESQARPLTRLSAPLQKEAWERAVETAPEGKVTARHVQNVVREIEGIETERKVTIIKQKIPKDEIVDEEFKNAFDAFYWEVQRVRMENWSKTSKEAALKFVILIKDLIEVK